MLLVWHHTVLPPSTHRQQFSGLPPKRSSFHSGSSIYFLGFGAFRAVTPASFAGHSSIRVLITARRSRDNTLKKSMGRVMWFST